MKQKLKFITSVLILFLTTTLGFTPRSQAGAVLFIVNASQDYNGGGFLEGAFFLLLFGGLGAAALAGGNEAAGGIFIVLGEENSNPAQFESELRSSYPKIEDRATYQMLAKEISSRLSEAPILQDEEHRMPYLYVTIPAERISSALESLNLDPVDSNQIIRDLSE